MRRLRMPVAASGMGVPGMLKTLKASILKRRRRRSVMGITLKSEALTCQAQGPRRYWLRSGLSPLS